MSGVEFTAALFAGSASIAAWIFVRFPKFGPSSLIVRGAVPLAAVSATRIAPVGTSTYLELYGSVFGLLLPLLVVSWLGCAWLLQSLRDLAANGLR